MKIINILQNSPEWLEFRKGKITGTKSSDCLSLSRKTADGSTVSKGWWALLAERLTGEDEKGISENAMERGHDLERDCAEITVAKFNLKNPNYNCGIWQSSDNENLILSPDCHEDIEKPTWAVECKALNSANHIQTIFRALENEVAEEERPQARFSANYQIGLLPIDLIPQKYKEQAVDYFIVNPDLKTLYFSLYDPRFKNPKLCHWVFVIEREDIKVEIENLRNAQTTTLEELDFVQDLIFKLLEKFNGNCSR